MATNTKVHPNKSYASHLGKTFGDVNEKFEYFRVRDWLVNEIPVFESNDHFDRECTEFLFLDNGARRRRKTTRNSTEVEVKVGALQRQVKHLQSGMDKVLKLLGAKGSFYKSIDGTKYKRSLLEMADEAVRSGGVISKTEIGLIWQDIQKDGKVSDLELRTLLYIEDNYKLTKSALSHIQALSIHVGRAVEAGHNTVPSPPASPSSE